MALSMLITSLVAVIRNLESTFFLWHIIICLLQEEIGYNCLRGECTLIVEVHALKLFIAISMLIPLIVMVLSNFLTWRLVHSTAKYLRSSK